jgi:hypothetical protein
MLLLAGCGIEAPRQGEYAATGGMSAESVVAEASGADVVGAIDLNLQRKIIYEADVQLVVEDFAQTEKQVPDAVKRHGGYLAEVTIDRTQGRRLTGRWVARIPVDQYEAFLAELSKLGVPESFHQRAQDVTEEFVDLEARIANKRQLEERVLQLLEESQGSIKDILEVERELERVRTEVEQMDGRLRYLTNRTDLTTITIDAIHIRDYVPPQAPTFLSRIVRSWDSSLVSLRLFAENLVVLFVFLAPWIVTLMVVLLPMASWVRRRRKRRAAETDQQGMPEVEILDQ